MEKTARGNKEFLERRVEKGMGEEEAGGREGAGTGWGLTSWFEV